MNDPAQSRADVDTFLRHERQAVEQLAGDIGREVVDKLDRILLRDLIADRAAQLRTPGADTRAQTAGPARHRVLITLSSTRPEETGAMLPGRRDRRQSVALRRRATDNALRGLLQDLDARGARVLDRFWLTHSVAAELPSAALVEVAARGDVANVVSMKVRWTTRAASASQTPDVARYAPVASFDGMGVRVAILDTGVEADHPALFGTVSLQQDFTGDGIGDAHGHGTHCAGIIAGQDPTYPGIAPGATLVDLKMIDYFGCSEPQMALAGLQAAVVAGVDVACCPWGFSHFARHWSDPPAVGTTDGTCVLCSAVDNAAAAGLVVVVAAGNDGADPCSTYDTHVNCPGLARTAITVGASHGSESMAGFSSVGPTPDGRLKPDVVAPGAGIVSCRASGTGLGSPIDANFTRNRGTSPAASYVAGVVALMLEKNPALSPAQVKDVLLATAVNIGASSDEMGAGCVDVAAAVSATPAH